MNKKFTIDAIKNLKIKVKELDGNLTSYYTPSEFKPDDSFQLCTEDNDAPEFGKEMVNNMITALNKIDNRTWDEFESGKILFENLRITPKQASDIGFWTYNNHYTFYRYIAKRWGDVWDSEKEIANPASYVLNHWIQSNSSQSELIIYPISGLWWSFYLTVDEMRDDKYELTRMFLKNYTLRVVQMGQTRFARHKPAIHGVLEFIKENNLDRRSLEQSGRAIVPYINLLGGIRPLSYFDKEWFKTKLKNRFGEQIKSNEKLFIRPLEVASENRRNTPDKPLSYETKMEESAHYFCLNNESGNYIISSKQKQGWDYCIGLDFESNDQFLVHFYLEGKIKKTKVKGSLTNKIVDRVKPYSNGKCQKLKLLDVQLISQPVLFGIAYKTKNGVYFKAMDEQSLENFRTDNSELHQEGKKVLYINEPFSSAYKILPYELKDALGTLVQQSPTGRGADIANPYHSEKWKALRNHWGELFNGTLKWT